MQIIFITGYPDFMAEGYEVSALHYLIKPVKEDKVFDVLTRAQNNLNRKERVLFFHLKGEMFRIPLAQIYYLEAEKHYVLIHTVHGDYRIKQTFSELETSLEEAFFRCQRSFIINLRYVQKITRSCIVLENGVEVPPCRN